MYIVIRVLQSLVIGCYETYGLNVEALDYVSAVASACVSVFVFASVYAPTPAPALSSASVVWSMVVCGILLLQSSRTFR